MPAQTVSQMQSIVAAHAIIVADLSTHVSISSLARKTGTNTCHLKKGFKSVYRITIYQYLLRARMSKARELLEHSHLSHTEIGFACGYESLAGFTTAYRKFYGMAPGRYRKERAGNV